MTLFSKRKRLRFGVCLCAAILFLGSPVEAMQLPGAMCGDPDANGLAATDGLFILNVAIGLQQCDDCICNLDGLGDITATDALLALRAAVGSTLELRCPACAGTTTTTFANSTTTTTTVTTSTVTTTTTTTVTTTTVPAGDGFPLPKDVACDVTFSAEGSGALGFLVFNVFWNADIGDFERNGTTFRCRAIFPGKGVTASALDGANAPGHSQMSFLTTNGLPMPSPVMACSFVAGIAGADTSIFSISVKTATNTFFQAVPVNVEITAANCGAA